MPGAGDGGLHGGKHKTPVVRAAEPRLDPVVVAGNNQFAVELYQRLAAGTKGNFCFSPWSVRTALAMVEAGARGQTAAELAQVLHLPAKPADRQAMARWLAWLQQAGPGVELTSANMMWGQEGYPWRDEFLGTLRNHYGAALREVDFANARAAREQINEWTARQTGGRVAAAMPDGALDVETRLVLGSALHFQGEWASQFKRADTKPGNFTCLDGRQVTVPMMYHERGRWAYTWAEEDRYEVLELPYRGGRLAMVVIIPDVPRAVNPKTGQIVAGAGTEREHFPAVERMLTAERVTFTTGNLGIAGLYAMPKEVYLPRFRLAAQPTLDDALQVLGVKAAWSLDAADFSGMAGGKEPLALDTVLHQATVTVNESGTEAAADTEAEVVASFDDPDFRVNQPFIFLIRDRKTGAILFMGRVVDPTKA